MRKLSSPLGLITRKEQLVYHKPVLPPHRGTQDTAHLHRSSQQSAYLMPPHQPYESMYEYECMILAYSPCTVASWVR